MSFVLVLLAGIGYCFPLYSDALMHALGMSRSQLTLVPALLNVGGGLVTPAGFCITTWGLKIAIMIAGILMIVGYLGMYTISTVTAVQSVLGDLGLVAVAYLLAFTMGHGSGWLDCIAVTANTTNYPTAKGQATGITKCIFGVAAPTITLLFITFNGTQSDTYPLRAERLVNNPSEYAAISPAMARSDFLYYYSGLSAAYGGGLAFINNQAQIIPSADTTDRAHIVGALLTTVTATSAASRVITGWAADRLTFLSRPGYVVLLIAMMAAAFTAFVLVVCGH
ncbi:hypothetical protein Pmar_PMAR016134 [Perkinsus marinus ATCC 50983]|uniref:Nodulin-like domain-containing protein n=1 Tax=Perkinsus marinus (strain ATCC 50983 / TXsc) TaxID=423536 RepID=C5LZ47_PERM5|nr:hypothetical protein Pmar_PMAR016134 [Perkinsus marinus ATCC 50983]EEQ98056.1 hypothetical protein Pmar_PMAR016134 [Perkinsus marinus ATCC 50983]|eukprot:XP_002765339.1 hypothetical protein Pmar_PMAR016134 [Perkinsus marinus ATCC 50983]